MRSDFTIQTVTLVGRQPVVAQNTIYSVIGSLRTSKPRPLPVMAAGPNPAESLRGLVLGVLLAVSVQAAGNAAVFDIGSDFDLLIYAEVGEPMEEVLFPLIFSKFRNTNLITLNYIADYILLLSVPNNVPTTYQFVLGVGKERRTLFDPLRGLKRKHPLLELP